MNRYLYINQEDKAKLQKQAFAKQLSLSTYVALITEVYNYLGQNIEGYLTDTTQKTHLKIKNKHFTDKSISNSVYIFLHGNETEYKVLNLKKLNSMIQSKADKTYDPNFMKNYIIRTTYRR